MKTKYIIEGNIDFYSEINEDINSDTDNNEDDQYDNKCLITNEILRDKFVTMECGHKFNYIPLYNDLFKQKYYTNFMEENKLRINEIRCPYCRKITTQLIPYYDNFSIINDVYVRKIKGINNYELNQYTKNIDYILLNKEKSIWEKEKDKILKYQKKQLKEDAKNARLHAREEKIKIKEEKKRQKEETMKIKKEKKRQKEDTMKIKKEK